MDPYLSTGTSGQSGQNATAFMGGGSPSVLNLVPVPAPTTSSPQTVVNSKAATDNLNGIQGNTDLLKTGVQSQAQNIWSTQTLQQQADAEQASKAQDQKNQLAQIDAKKSSDDKLAGAISGATSALNGTPAALPPGYSVGVGQDHGIIKDPTGQVIGYQQGGQNLDTNGQPLNLPSTNSGDQLAQNSANRDQATKSYTDQVNQIFQGVFPLNSSQLALVNALKQSLTQAENAQKLANANYEGAQNIANVTSGRSRYAPEIAAGLVQAAVSAGIAKIQELDNAAAVHLAELQQGFQKDDLDMITKAYNATIANLDAKTAEIHKMQEVAATAARDAQDKKHQDLVDELSVSNSKLDQSKFDYAQQQDKIQNAFKTQQITLDEKKFLLDQQHTQIQDSIAKAELALKQGEFNATYNFGGGTGGSGMTPQDIPGVRTTNQGVSYFDPTQFSDAKQKKAAENIARNAGIPILSDKTDTEAMTNIDGALQNLSTLEQMFNNLAPGNIPGAALVDKAKNAAGGLLSHTGIYTTDRQAEIQAYNSNRDQLFKQIYALAGGHPRVNSVELQQAANALPRLTITSMDTAKVGDEKLNLTRKYLYNAIKAVVPNANLPESGDKIYNTSEELLKAHPDRAQQAADLATKGYTDADIKVILNY